MKEILSLALLSGLLVPAAHAVEPPPRAPKGEQAAASPIPLHIGRAGEAVERCTKYAIRWHPDVSEAHRKILTTRDADKLAAKNGARDFVKLQKQIGRRKACKSVYEWYGPSGTIVKNVLDQDMKCIETGAHFLCERPKFD